jgi:hypothetical protein
MTKRSCTVALAALALVGVTACSSGGGKQSSATTTSAASTARANATTTAPRSRPTQHTTPPSSGYFQVVQVIGRTSTAGRCHTFPTTVDCLKLGHELGTTPDLVDFGPPHRNSYGDWIIDTLITQRLADNINRNLHRELAFIVNGTVYEIVSFVGPVRVDAAHIFNAGPNQATALTLVNSLRNLRRPQP